MNGVCLSVIVTSYNYERYIGQTLSALVNQTVTDFEVIVVDDGSTDNSVLLIEDFCEKYPNIRLFQHKKNKGLPESIRLGIENSLGEYIAFCESDDYWDSHHVEKLINYLHDNKDADLIFNCISVINQLPDKKMDDYAKECNYFLKENHKKNIFLSLVHNYMPTFSAACIRKNLLESCDFNSYHSHYIDFWLWRQLCFDHIIHFLPEVITYWRRHNESYDFKEGVEDITEFLFHSNKLLMRKVRYTWLDMFSVHIFKLFHKSRWKIVEYEMRRIYQASRI